jgi:DNA-binding MarR family transcriptional regulator
MLSTFEHLFNRYDEKYIALLEENMAGTSLDHLTINHYEYLRAIGILGAPTLTQLAEYLEITKPSTTVMVNKLIKEDLVHKLQSTEDKRLQIVRLTELGNKVITAEKEAFLIVFQMLFSHLTDEEQKQLKALLEKGLSNAE